MCKCVIIYMHINYKEHIECFAKRFFTKKWICKNYDILKNEFAQILTIVDYLSNCETFHLTEAVYLHCKSNVPTL